METFHYCPNYLSIHRLQAIDKPHLPLLIERNDLPPTHLDGSRFPRLLDLSGLASGRCRRSDRGPANIDRLQALRSRLQVEFHRFAFFQRATALRNDRGVMDKYVLAAFAADEAEPFDVVEPFH